jgi:steroid 5-alpha reductase family enzyme
LDALAGRYDFASPDPRFHRSSFAFHAANSCDDSPVIMQQAEHLAWMGAAIVAVMMLVVWIIHLLIRNAAIVDVGWAAGLAVLAFFYAIAAPGYFARKWAMAAMVGFWGLRLAAYLLFARVIGKTEEGRYVQLRKEWKTYLPFRFLFLFEFQAVLVVVLSLPFLLACVNPAAPLARIEKIGAGIWLLAVIGEAVADEQLNRFKKNPANSGKTLRAGLWKYSRHPNYFFDWLVWVGYAGFALGSPWGWLGLISPALVLYFLLSITGIPATEAQALRTRGNEYREYQRTTSIFVPWFPKKEAL